MERIIDIFKKNILLIMIFSLAGGLLGYLIDLNTNNDEQIGIASVLIEKQTRAELEQFDELDKIVAESRYNSNILFSQSNNLQNNLVSGDVSSSDYEVFIYGIFSKLLFDSINLSRMKSVVQKDSLFVFDSQTFLNIYKQTLVDENVVIKSINETKDQLSIEEIDMNLIKNSIDISTDLGDKFVLKVIIYNPKHNDFSSTLLDNVIKNTNREVINKFTDLLFQRLEKYQNELEDMKLHYGFLKSNFIYLYKSILERRLEFLLDDLAVSKSLNISEPTRVNPLGQRFDIGSIALQEKINIVAQKIKILENINNLSNSKNDIVNNIIDEAIFVNLFNQNIVQIDEYNKIKNARLLLNNFIKKQIKPVFVNNSKKTNTLVQDDSMLAMITAYVLTGFFVSLFVILFKQNLFRKKL